MDILDWGIDWLHKQQQLSVNETLLLTWTTGTRSVFGSLVDEAGRMVPGQGAKTITEFTRFLITTSQLVDVPLVRGLMVTWKSHNYELTPDGIKCWYFNDALRRGTILVTKHVSN